MKLRDPGKKLPDCTLETINLQNKNKWKTYRITLITPMFGGGVTARKPDMDMPVRASAIRGQLRYWWRFRAKNRADSPLSGKKLFKEEREIWGGMAENNEDFSSKVRLKVENIQGVDSRLYNGTEAGYALFPARQQTDENCAKKLIREGMTFDLKIYAPDDIMAIDIIPALSWWATFGGIGARTRRGVGAVHCDDIDPINHNEALQVGCQLVVREDRYTTAHEAWNKAIYYLKQFRQGNGLGRRTGHHRSYWPEPDSIREITGLHKSGHKPEHDARIAFPRAAFGLPIIFKFKNDNRGEPPQTELTPENFERLASPLILTPYPIKKRTGNQQYAPAALRLPKEHVDSMSLNLSYTQGQNLDICPNGNCTDLWEEKGWDAWPTNWWNQVKANDVKPIKDNKGQDALTAFLNYFANGGPIHD